MSVSLANSFVREVNQKLRHGEAEAPAIVTKQLLPALTGVRGVAAWWVVLFHFTGYLPTWVPEPLQKFVESGYLAVDLFFVLSGFVIALNYQTMFCHFDFRKYLRFIGLRLARIYPLHAFMLLLYLLNPLAILLAASAPTDMSRYDPFYYLLSFLLVQNWAFTSNLAWNIPAWSISAEWAAYLAFPALVWVATRANRTLMRAIALITALLLILGSAFWAADGSLGSYITSLGLLRCIVEFSAGICLYQVWTLKRLPGLVADAFGIFAIAAVVLTQKFGIPDFVLVPFAFLLLIFAFATPNSFLARMADLRFIEMIGLASYSTYLVHYFVKDWIKFIVVHHDTPSSVPMLTYLLLTAGSSFLLYRYIEVPGRRLLRRMFLPPLTPALASQ
jgi:peptidoglycan/LPS O-acetylase OafA/YrhL